MNDIYGIFNSPQPVEFGGTNATNASQARDNLGLEIGVDIPSNAQLTSSGQNSRRNRIVNHDKTVSQENGQTAGTNNGRYISDQNAMFFVTSNGVFTGVNVTNSPSPAGGFRDRITITTPDSALAAGEYLTYTQNLEGSNVRSLKWGATGALGVVIRRGFRFPAGTWPVALHNSATNRSYVTTFTVSALEANTDIVREFVIPGDVTGTWLKDDGVIGLTMDVAIGSGSTFQGVAGWQAGNILTVAGASNGMNMAGAVFEFFDEGLRLDPDATGVYGQYEVGEVDAVYRAERYSRKGWLPLIGWAVSGGDIGRAQCGLSIAMCKKPTISFYGQVIFENGTSAQVSSVGANYSTSTSVEIDLSVTPSVMVANRTYLVREGAGGGWLLLSRLS